MDPPTIAVPIAATTVPQRSPLPLAKENRDTTGIVAAPNTPRMA